jgi:hypothetical protein
VEYAPGVGQASVQKFFEMGSDRCGGEAAADAFCSRFSALGEVDARKRSSAACGGDSGAGLFQVGDGGDHELVALVSYVSPSEDCGRVQIRRTFFIDLTHPGNLAWIMTEAGQVPPPNVKAQVCGDGLLIGGAKAVALLDSPERFSVTAFAATGEVSDIHIGGVDAAGCEQGAEGRFTSCRVRPGDKPTVQVMGEGAQITSCWAGRGN